MAVEEIARDQWVAALDAFSQQHYGWLVTVETLEPDAPANVLARDAPLWGVHADTGLRGGGAISITVGRGTTYTIYAPVSVRIEQAEGFADTALVVESAGGVKTMVRFRVPARPEAVDGMLPGELATVQ